MKKREETMVQYRLLVEAIKPLAAIADKYEASELDEHRPEWNERKAAQSEVRWEDIELYASRGGGTLLTLMDAFKARYALNGTTIPESIKAKRDERCMKLEKEYFPISSLGSRVEVELHVKNCRCV